MENKKYCPRCITLTVKLVGEHWKCSTCGFSRKDGPWRDGKGNDGSGGYGGVREPRRPNPKGPAVEEKKEVLCHS